MTALKSLNRQKSTSLLFPSIKSAVLAFGLGVTVSCGGGGGADSTAPPPPITPAPVATVTVSPGTPAIGVGASQQLTATMRDAAGNTLAGRTVAWTTSDSKIVSISSTGIATGNATGQATVSAVSEGKSGSAVVTVTPSDPGGSVLSFTVVASGGAHTCALTTTGAAYCWGRGETGQLGVPAPETKCSIEGKPWACSPLPIAVSGAIQFVLLAAGATHTCGLTSDGTAYCWGSNSTGQLGNNSTTFQSAPVPVGGGLKFSSLDAGASHTCGVTTAGVGYCWGSNGRGQLGDGSVADRLVPAAVAGGLTFRSITAGGFTIGHSCGVTLSGAAFCWGDNERGQLGIGTSDQLAHPAPVAVMGGFTFSGVTVGLDRHSCGSTVAGVAYCWGENVYGALGDGTTTDRAAPALVSSNLAFAKLIAGGFIGHTCGLIDSGVAFCWGENSRGQVGDGSYVDRLTPSEVAGAQAYKSIDAGFSHTCAIRTAGTLYCWGANAAGQLGIGSTGDSNIPVKVVGQP